MILDGSNTFHVISGNRNRNDTRNASIRRVLEESIIICRDYFLNSSISGIGNRVQNIIEAATYQINRFLPKDE